MVEPATPSGSELRRTVLTLGAAWLVPGLGHVLVGRVRRGIVFAVLVAGSFGLGLANDGRLSLHDRDQPLLSSLQLIANVGVGAADLVARLAVYGEPAYAIPASRANPAAVDRREILRERTRAPLSNYGTAYLWTAGLMNLLLVFDVWDLLRGRKA